jgi:hypothetical protein
MHHPSRGHLFPVIALALVAVACGSPDEDQGVAVGPTAPVALEQALAEGRPARAIVLLDDAAPQAAAQEAALRADPRLASSLAADSQAVAVMVMESAKDRLLAESTSDEVEVVHRYQRLPAMHVELRSTAALRRLLASGEVVRVVEDEPHEAALAQSLPLIRQPAAAAAGATGQGTAVAVLDTGVDYTRRDFGTCSAPGVPGCKVAFARDFAPDDHALDASGHGTNVAGVVLGVAPGAQVLALDVFDGRYAYTSDILEAIDWVIANRAQFNIVAMNLSLGSGGTSAPCTGDAFAGAIHAARAAGILGTVAAGNDGRSNRISSPACVPEAVSVGAVYDADVGGIAYGSCSDMATGPDQVACFSNSASFLTVLAPGALITAAGITMAGTSQAAPHVAGAIAVWKSVDPSATPDQLVTRLRGGPMVTDPRNGLRFPRLDLGPAAAAACVADLTAASGAVAGQGGALTVALRTGGACAWTIGSTPAWLGVSPRSGIGPATLTVTAAPNAGGPRSAQLSAGGAAVAVTQATDRTVPTASLLLAGGAAYTRSLSVTLAVGGTDPAGVAAMCLSNTPTCTAWRPFAPAVSWTLAAGVGGARTVYLRLKDGAGNVSAPIARSITYDVSAPAGGRLTAATGAGAVSLSWPGYVDATSGVSRYTLVGSPTAIPASCAEGTRLYAGTATAFVQTGLRARARYFYRLCATDGAGNTSAGATATVIAR